MYQVQTHNCSTLICYGLLSTLILFALSACTKTVGPKIDKHAVPYKVGKPKATVKVPKRKVPTEVAKSKEPTKIVASKTYPKIVESKKPSKISKPVIAKSTKLSKSVNAKTPCDMADPGYGIYHPWKKNLKMGRMLMPKKEALTADGGFDLIIHFHGGNAVRKTIVDIARGVYIAAVDLGAGSGAYERPFSKPEVFLNLLGDVEKAVAKHTKNKRAHVRRLGLTGWSAGYGAIRAILRQKASKRVDAVVLIDGLHSNYSNASRSELRHYQLKPFVRFAKYAAQGERFMFVSHSSIVPPGYASTTETAHYLAKKLGVMVSRSSAKDSPLLWRYQQAKSGGFLMRGYLGEGKVDHCAQIALMAGAVAALEKRWKTPKAEGRRYAHTKSKPVDKQSPKPSVARVDHLRRSLKQSKKAAVAIDRSS